ncbi:MAG: phage integrase SAM-like domain-containing protein, partial [Muribaculum sp.]|nr:phage integrase SAM-like domain-containing protein [Muribaculum sp.]
MTAIQANEFLLNGLRKTDALKDYAESYVSKLKEGGQKSYSQNTGYTLKYLVECFGENMTLQQININTVRQWEKYLFDQGNSSTTVNILMSQLISIIMVSRCGMQCLYLW